LARFLSKAHKPSWVSVAERGGLLVFALAAVEHAVVLAGGARDEDHRGVEVSRDGAPRVSGAGDALSELALGTRDELEEVEHDEHRPASGDRFALWVLRLGVARPHRLGGNAQRAVVPAVGGAELEVERDGLKARPLGL